MTPDGDEMLDCLASIRTIVQRLGDTLALMPMHSELSETMLIASSKRGSRRWADPREPA